MAAEVDYSRGESGTVLTLLEEARHDDDPVVYADALNLAHHCLLGPAHDRRRRELATELIEQSFSTGRRSDLVMGQLWHVVDLFLAGDRWAVRHHRELHDQLCGCEHSAGQFVLDAMDVMLTIRAGELGEAERLAAHTARAGAAAGDADAAGWHGAHMVAIRWYQGRLAELVPMLADMIDSRSLTVVDHSYRAAYAVATALAGDRRAPAAALAALRGDHLATVPQSSSWLVTMYGVVEAAYLLGDAELAAEAYECLLPYAGLPMMASLAVTCFGSVQHALGVAALTTSDGAAAVAHLRSAIQRNLALGHWPATTMSRHRYAEAIRRRRSAADLAAAGCEHRAADTHAAPADTVARSRPDATIAGGRATCLRRGDGWTVRWRERTVFVGPSVGMLHLAVLTANPGQELPCVDLAGGVAALTGAGSDSSSDQPLLDRTAIRHYRERLAQLHAHPDLPRRDPRTRSGAHGREEQWLAAELAGATGLGGRARRFPDNAERARVAVGKAIRRAIAKIAAADPALGHHLSDCIHTGTRCVYRPLA